MEIIALFEPYIYSIRYDGQEQNEFDRLMSEWNDISQLLTFLENNRESLRANVWKEIDEPFKAARQVLDEAAALEELFERLYEHTQEGKTPDFDSHFQYLDGKYKYEIKYQPMKSYGQGTPSLLRIYAIKMDDNIYLITGGGVKLGSSIQNSPGLKDHVLQNIDNVRAWLRQNGIIDGDDLKNE